MAGEFTHAIARFAAEYNAANLAPESGTSASGRWSTGSAIRSAPAASSGRDGDRRPDRCGARIGRIGSVARTRRSHRHGCGRVHQCVASSIYDFDDAHLATVVHPTGPVASALFAVRERRRIRGEEFLLALIIGIELQCRLANALAVEPAGMVEGCLNRYHRAGGDVRRGRSRTRTGRGGADRRDGGRRRPRRRLRGAGAWPRTSFRPGRRGRATSRLPGPTRARQFGSTARRSTRIGTMFGIRANWDALVDGLGERWDLVDNASSPTRRHRHPWCDHRGRGADRGPGFNPNLIDRIELTVHRSA